MAKAASSTLVQFLYAEDAALDAAQNPHPLASQAACDRPVGNREDCVRILALAGIANLTQHQTCGFVPGIWIARTLYFCVCDDE
jgi:hypothetical protein